MWSKCLAYQQKPVRTLAKPPRKLPATRIGLEPYLTNNLLLRHQMAPISFNRPQVCHKFWESCPNNWSPPQFFTQSRPGSAHHGRQLVNGKNPSQYRVLANIPCISLYDLYDILTHQSTSALQVSFSWIHEPWDESITAVLDQLGLSFGWKERDQNGQAQLPAKRPRDN